MSLTLRLLADVLAICRLDASAATPTWADHGPFLALTRTEDELSIVCPQVHVPVGVVMEPDWRMLKVAGPLDFNMVGVLAGISGALARAGISLFVLSTFDTDYILVKGADLGGAINVLESAGYTIQQPEQSE